MRLQPVVGDGGLEGRRDRTLKKDLSIQAKPHPNRDHDGPYRPLPAHEAQDKASSMVQILQIRLASTKLQLLPEVTVDTR